MEAGARGRSVSNLEGMRLGLSPRLRELWREEDGQRGSLLPFPHQLGNLLPPTLPIGLDLQSPPDSQALSAGQCIARSPEAEPVPGSRAG